MPSGLHNWSQTASSNASADSAINWAEGQAPSSVNDSARAVMAVLAKHRDDTAGSLTTGGTSTAYTLTTNTVFTTLALLSGQRLKVKFNATNGASATLNVDGLGAKALQLYSGTAVPTGMITANSIWDVTYDNSIPAFIVAGIPAKLPSNTIDPASLAVSATQRIVGRYSASAGAGEELTLGTGLLLSASGVLSAASSAGVQVINGTLAESNGTNAATYALKTLAGTDPSSTDPVYVIFRNATVGTGNYVVRTVTAALSIVIPSGATMGFTSNTAGRLWFGLLDNAGTVELCAINCLSGTNIYPLGQFPIITTTTIDTASDSAHVAYSTTGRTSKPYVVLGYANYEGGSNTIVTAGTWNVSPLRIQLYAPGVLLPGQPIQTQSNSTGAYATGTTALPFDDSIPQISEGTQILSQAITPTSAANVLEIDWRAGIASSTGDANGVAALFQDSTANALTAFVSPNYGSTAQVTSSGFWRMLAGTSSATTFKVRAGNGSANAIYFNGSAAARILGGAIGSYLRVIEFMT
jgi:hypothetical protein